MSELFWKLTGKPAIDSVIKGYQVQGKSNEDIITIIEKSRFWDKRQIRYAKEKLKETRKNE